MIYQYDITIYWPQLWGPLIPYLVIFSAWNFDPEEICLTLPSLAWPKVDVWRSWFDPEEVCLTYLALPSLAWPMVDVWRSWFDPEEVCLTYLALPSLAWPMVDACRSWFSVIPTELVAFTAQCCMFCRPTMNVSRDTGLPDPSSHRSCVGRKIYISYTWNKVV